MSSENKISRHQRMLSAFNDSSSDDEASSSAPAVTKKAPTAAAIRPVANPIPTVGKKKATEEAVAKFGAALAEDSSDDDFDKPVMAKATPKPHPQLKKGGYNPTTTPTTTAAAPKKIAETAPAAAVAPAAAAAKKEKEAAGPAKKKALFDDEDDDNAADGVMEAIDVDGLSRKALAAVEGTAGISINRNYADRYDAVKRKQELQQLADKYKLEYDEEESDETDEEEDEFGDELNDPDADEMWAEVFYKLRQKDPSITDKSVGFFKALEEEKKKRAAEAAANGGDGKKHTLKDEYQRAIMGGEEYDTTAQTYIDEEDRPGKLKPRTAEERAAKAAFLSAVGAAADEDDDLIQKKEGGKSSAEIYGAAGGKKEKSAKKHVSKLAEAFTVNEAATEEEKKQEDFLKSFFLNEKWREDGDDDSEDEDNEYTGAGINRKGMKKGDVNWEQLAKEDQDEMFFEEAEQWEKEFQEKQFHHEMVDSEADLQVKSFPRRATLAAQATAASSNVGSVTISTLKSINGEREQTVTAIAGGGDGLLRKQESTRAEARRRKKERAEEAERQRIEELKRLKTLKRMEIEEKRDMIARVAGFLKGGSTANTNDASLDDFNLENPFAANSSDPKDDKKKSKKDKKAAPVEGNTRLLEQLSKVWSNEELEKDFDSAEFDKKMAALFDTDEFNNDIDEEEIARIRAEIEADDDMAFGVSGGGGGGDDEDDEGLDAEELAEKLLNEEVDVGFGDDAEDKEGLFFANDDDEDDENGGIMGDDELFGGLQGVLSLEKKKDTKKKANVAEDEEDNLLYAPSSTNDDNNNADADDELTALLYPTAVMSKLEKEAAAKNKKKESALTISANSKKSDLQAYLGDLQKELDNKVDEYNKLHYDKVLAGGVKTRFRYRTVNAENFGLTDEDILTKDDRTLNMIAPMKLYASFLGPKENKRDRQRCISRIQNLRQLDPTRRSRRYGDVSKTILFDPSVGEEEGKALAARIRLSTKKLIASNDAEDVAEEAEKDLKEIRAAKKAAKSAASNGGGGVASSTATAGAKRPREEDAKAPGGQPPAQRKPFEGRGGFRGGNGRGSGNFSRGRGGFSSNNNNGASAGGRGGFSRGGNGGGNFRGGRGFSNGPRGRGTQ